MKCYFPNSISKCPIKIEDTLLSKASDNFYKWFFFPFGIGLPGPIISYSSGSYAYKYYKNKKYDSYPSPHLSQMESHDKQSLYVNTNFPTPISRRCEMK